MTRHLILSCAAIGLTVAWLSGSAATRPVLPFYDSIDWTPKWTRSVDHRVADFSLIDQTASPVTRAGLLGRVHVASFVYTRCAGVCPAMVTQLKKVQHAIQGLPDAVLVSYSVTPDVDTPASLADFGRLRGVDAAKWKLVTGDADVIYQLARASYFADDGRLDARMSAAEQFLHSEKAVLVDRGGRLRGVYNATVPHDIDKLIADLERLLGSGE